MIDLRVDAKSVIRLLMHSIIRRRNKRGATTLQQELKLCTKCKEEKPVDQFGKRVGGYQSWCKKCTNEATRARNKARYHEDADYRRKVLDNKAEQIQEERKRAVEARSRQLRRQAGLED
jgi:hypothetical protein